MLPQTLHIKGILNILDLNINFEKYCLTKEKDKGQICSIYKRLLTYFRINSLNITVSALCLYSWKIRQIQERLDIVENQCLTYLEHYFSRLSLATREAVQWIVIDMYTPYVSLVKKFLPQIQNALHYSYSNGSLECLNNHIKVLKRNAYGFHSFYDFKLRIMICHGKTFLTK
ncbi:transposase [Enterococcus durans]